MQFDVLEGVTGPGDGDLPLRRAVGVVEGGPRGAAFGYLPQVPDRQGVLETPFLGVQGWHLEVQQVEYLTGLRELALDHEDLFLGAGCSIACGNAHATSPPVFMVPKYSVIH